MQLDEVVRTTPTIRYYTDQPVNDGVLYKILDSARFAPNGGNRQGWHVVVVKDGAVRRQLRDLYLEAWRPYSRRARQGGLAPKSMQILDQADDFAQNIDCVPVHLVVCVWIPALAITDGDLRRPSIVGGASIYPFVQNVLLASRDAGLGATLTTVLCCVEPKVKDLLRIPDDFGIAALVAVGHPEPSRTPRRLSRAEVERFTTLDRFDGAPFSARE